MTSYQLRETGSPAGRPITGRTVIYLLAGFFGVIFAANAIFVWLAVGSFPGLEVESSYKAGQEYNDEVAAAAEQAARGWNVDVRAVPGEGGTALTARFADKSGAPERLLTVTATFQHPTDTRHDRSAALSETEPGVYTGIVADIAAGSWTLVVEAKVNGDQVFRSRNLLALGR